LGGLGASFGGLSPPKPPVAAQLDITRAATKATEIIYFRLVNIYTYAFVDPLLAQLQRHKGKIAVFDAS